MNPSAMAGHVKILAILHLVFGALGLLAGLLIFAIFGGIAGLVGASGADGSFVAVPILGAIGIGVAVFATVLSLPGILAGFGLLQFRPWARILTIVLSALELLNFPFGTALGAYGLWVMLNNDTERLFGISRLRV